MLHKALDSKQATMGYPYIKCVRGPDPAYLYALAPADVTQLG